MSGWRYSRSRQFWGLHVPSLSLSWTGCGILIDRENIGFYRMLDNTRTFDGQNYMDDGEVTRVWVGLSEILDRL